MIITESLTCAAYQVFDVLFLNLVFQLSGNLALDSMIFVRIVGFCVCTLFGTWEFEVPTKFSFSDGGCVELGGKRNLDKDWETCARLYTVYGCFRNCVFTLQNLPSYK